MHYKAPWWTPEGHTQTIFAAKLARRPAVHYHRVRWGTPDGDFIDLDFTEPTERHSSAKHLWVMFHGLEGSSQSHYSLTLMARAKASGVLGVVVHFRGCSGEDNLLPRTYYAGDTPEMDWILRRLCQEFPQVGPLNVIGVSLGGNMLLKWLGEQQEAALPIVARAISVSAPVDLYAGVMSLSKGFNRVYTRMFLGSLIPKALEKIRKFPELGDASAVAACKDIMAFDHLVTSRWHGYADALDLYAKSSAKPFTRHIAVPTLMLNAVNDPFMSGQHLPSPSEVSKAVRCLYTKHGGHVGFATGKGFRLSLDWLPDRVEEFFDGGLKPFKGEERHHG